MNILQTIVEERRSDIAAARSSVDLSALKESAAGRTYISLAHRLANTDGTAIIAEAKKASPSAGLLRPDFDAATIARMYEDAGAASLSILTEPRHFQGSAGDLRAARAVSTLPILRKDFICDSYQIWEAAAWGADVVLLIVAALDAEAVLNLHDEARAIGLDVLVETHSREELPIALACKDAIIGVNSRDLKTMTTDLGIAKELAPEIPARRIAVAESGIRTRSDIVELQALGYDGFLIGETLMRSDDPVNTIKQLLGAGD